MAAVALPAPDWGTPAVLHALEDLLAYHATVMSGRWSRATATTAVADFFGRVDPIRDAISALLPPVMLGEIVALQAAHFVVADPASPSGFSLPASWDLFPAGVWGPLKGRATLDWRLVGRIFVGLRAFSLANVPAPAVDPLVALQQQLVALQQQLAVQQAPIDASAAAALARAPVLPKSLIPWQEFVCLIESTFVPADLHALIPPAELGVAPGVLLPDPLLASPPALLPAPVLPPVPLTSPTAFRQKEEDVVAAVRGENVSPDALALSAPSKEGGQEAWDSFGEPKHFSTFVGGPMDVGDKPVPVTKSTRWPALLDRLWAETSAASLESAGTSVTQWQEFLSELSDAGASVPGMTSHACRMAAAFQGDPDYDFLGQGASIVGYLDDFFLVGSFEEVQEFMWLLHEFVVFLGFEVNADKCEGPGQCLEFLGIELSTADEVCTASISADRMLVVQAKVDEIRRLGSLGGAQWTTLFRSTERCAVRAGKIIEDGWDLFAATL
ncbi:hypothetical protein CYMTET_55356 [Cymbomonas tetramitiformis]|uniref:Reverse transcriptase domain-containing protein n=1 Tax=Cymbomonas tetramitiformis TaxID=36881 RepID=A0AAE0ENG8_9CHLO|nr:hypothetical protein CYMTET_55356 [Cymbomonas tetramitiformis]